MSSVTLTTTLDQVPTGEPLIIAGQAQDPAVRRRLVSLGWRPGTQTRVVKKVVGGARVIDLNGSRIAIGHQLARKLCVEAAA